VKIANSPIDVDWSAPIDKLVPGATFRTAERLVSQADVDAFARLTGDAHPQHVDEDWAAGSLFGERVAHGLLVLSAAAGLVPFDPERVVALRRVTDVVFKRPVRAGDSILVVGEIAAIRAPSLVSTRWRVVGADGHLRAAAKVEVVWR